MHDAKSLADPVIWDAYFAYKHLHNYKRLANFNRTIGARVVECRVTQGYWQLRII